MAWTTPKTDFADGNVLTAAQMNAIGNDLAFLHDSGGTLISTTTLSGSTTAITVPAGYKGMRLIIRDFSPSVGAYLAFRLNAATVSVIGSGTANAGTVATWTDTTNAVTYNTAILNGSVGQHEIEFPYYDNNSTIKLAKVNYAGTGRTINSTLAVTMSAASITAINLYAPTAANQASPTATMTGTAYLIGY